MKYSHFKPGTNLYEVYKSDNINLNDVCFSFFVLPVEDRIQDTVIHNQKVDKREGKKNKESSISKQTNTQRKMNVHVSFETELFFYLALLILFLFLFQRVHQQDGAYGLSLVTTSYILRVSEEVITVPFYVLLRN